MKQKILLFLKGLAMGSADVVPGVSGGTIAFISGIYEELLSSVKSFDFVALKMLFAGQFRPFWQKINGNFLSILLLGILTAIVSLAKVILYLLENQPILLWSFFFGLVLSSAWLVGTQIKRWTHFVRLALVLGAVLAYYLSSLQTPADTVSSLPYLFFCGAMAICAMILPGISGSFILLLLGAYQTIMQTIKQFVEAVLSFQFEELKSALAILGSFAAGCLVGLALFSRLLNWLFRRFHDVVVAVLIGFLLGSLNKIWPWKVVTGQLTEKQQLYANVSPFRYEALSGGQNAQFWAAILLFILGFALVYFLAMKEKSTKKN